MSKEIDCDRRKPGGPKTDEGKARSAGNSVRHGVLSEKIVVLQSENPETYNQLRRNYFDALQPVGFLECDLVEDIVWSKWRQIRAMRVETAAIDERMDLDAEYWERQCPTVDPDTRTAHAIKTLVDESNDLQHLSRYETRFHRMYHRSLRQLLELQERRKRDGATAPEQPLYPTVEPETETESRSSGSVQPAAQLNLPNELQAAFTKRNELHIATNPPPLAVAA
jgi:hypothetical protein